VPPQRALARASRPRRQRGLRSSRRSLLEEGSTLAWRSSPNAEAGASATAARASNQGASAPHPCRHDEVDHFDAALPLDDHVSSRQRPEPSRLRPIRPRPAGRAQINLREHGVGIRYRHAVERAKPLERERRPVAHLLPRERAARQLVRVVGVEEFELLIGEEVGRRDTSAWYSPGRSVRGRPTVTSP
jgi:hypothetical protein